jgi:hypothetical protein
LDNPSSEDSDLKEIPSWQKLLPQSVE